MLVCIECGKQQEAVVYDAKEKCYLCRECYVAGMLDLLFPKIKTQFEEGLKAKKMHFVSEVKQKLVANLEMKTRESAIRKFNQLRESQIKSGVIEPPMPSNIPQE